MNRNAFVAGPAPRNAFIDWLRTEVAKIPESPHRLSILNMARAGADTTLNWLDAADMAMRGEAPGTGFAGTGIGPEETIAPLGLGAMAPLAAVRNAAIRPYAESGVRASKMVGYDPRPVAQRAWDADYKFVPRSDPSGVLEESIDGAALTAPHIAGRRRLGEGDVGLEPQAIVAAAQGLVHSIQPATRTQMRGDVGRYTRRVDDAGEVRREILYDQNASDRGRPRIIAHEMGHAIDDLAAKIEPAGLMKELKQVYHDLATGQQGRTRHLTQPEHLRYRGDDVRAEYIAEAIRAYMVNPNYLKSVAPKTAKAIREAVNENPQIARVIQFNADPRAALPGTLIHAEEEQPPARNWFAAP